MRPTDDIPAKVNPVVILVVAIASMFLFYSSDASAQTTIRTENKESRTKTTVFDGSRSGSRIISADYHTILADVTSGKSKLAVVNMWATWCAPCIEEFPDFVALARHYDSSKLRVLFVSVDFEEQLPDVKSFLKSQKWERVSYLKNQKDDEFVSGFGDSWTGAVPATFVYDSDGTLLWFVEGKTTFSALTSVIESNVD